MIVEDENIEETVEETTPEFTVKAVDDSFVAPVADVIESEEEVIQEGTVKVDDVIVDDKIVPEPIELSDEKVLSYLKEKGVEVDKFKL